MEGAAFVWEATRVAARRRLETMLSALQEQGIAADGELGDYRPLIALRDAVTRHRPDLVVISTHAPERSSWLSRGVVTAAREELDVPVHHVVVGVGAVR